MAGTLPALSPTLLRWDLPWALSRVSHIYRCSAGTHSNVAISQTALEMLRMLCAQEPCSSWGVLACGDFLLEIVSASVKAGLLPASPKETRTCLLLTSLWPAPGLYSNFHFPRGAEGVYSHSSRIGGEQWSIPLGIHMRVLTFFSPRAPRAHHPFLFGYAKRAPCGLLLVLT